MRARRRTLLSPSLPSISSACGLGFGGGGADAEQMRGAEEEKAESDGATKQDGKRGKGSRQRSSGIWQ